MKRDLSNSKRFAPFLSLLALFGTLLALTLFLSQQILYDIARGQSSFDSALVPVVLVLPITLFGAVVYQTAQLWLDRRKNKPGTRLKIRLSVFFLITVLLSSVPQGILSITFIDTTMKNWLGTQLGDALKGGLNTALEYHRARIEELQNAAESPLLPEIVRKSLLQKDPSALARRLDEASLRPSSFQLFDDRGTLVLQTGNPKAYWTPNASFPLQDGPLPKETNSEFSLLRQLRHVEVNATSYAVVLSQILPPGFEDTSRGLTEALDNYGRLQKYNQTFQTLVYLFYLLFALPILLIAFLMSFTLSDDLIRPLINLESATRRIAEGDYSIRILTPGQDELAFLAESFNAMTSELAASRTKLQQTEKVTAWQEIARQLAHELRNPLTPIRLSAERILRKSQTDPSGLSEIIEPAVNAIVTEVQRLDSLLREFANFARLPAPQKTRIDAKSLIEKVLTIYRTSHSQIIFHTEGLKPGLSINADSSQLEQVFTNLVKNAIEAMKDVGEIFLRTSLVKKGNSPYCRIQIHDTGPGIAPDYRDQVFNPYFTTKPEGTGLGLAIVERIVFDHQGSVWFESQEGFGTTFFIDLPAEVPE